MLWYATDSLRDVALIRPGFSRATFPLGEGFFGVVQTLEFDVAAGGDEGVADGGDAAL